MKPKIEKLLIVLIILAAAGISPNLFVIAQAGYAKLSSLAITFLIPSIVVLALFIGIAAARGYRDIVHSTLAGLAGGLLGTVGLEVVRHIGFLLGGMPGEMPKLMGVLLLDRFALGPNTLSNLAGWGYHFWNGAAFGIIYSLLVGRGRVWMGIGYGILMGIGFMASPAAIALGVGPFGVDFGIGFPITVTLAHIVFGTLLGYYVSRKNRNAPTILSRLKEPGLF